MNGCHCTKTFNGCLGSCLEPVDIELCTHTHVWIQWLRFGGVIGAPKSKNQRGALLECREGSRGQRPLRPSPRQPRRRRQTLPYADSRRGRASGSRLRHVAQVCGGGIRAGRWRMPAGAVARLTSMEIEIGTAKLSPALLLHHSGLIRSSFHPLRLHPSPQAVSYLRPIGSWM